VIGAHDDMFGLDIGHFPHGCVGSDPHPRLSHIHFLNLAAGKLDGAGPTDFDGGAQHIGEGSCIPHERLVPLVVQVADSHDINAAAVLHITCVIRTKGHRVKADDVLPHTVRRV